ncbi:universal stress protein [Bradyrhizobium sp. CCBAU 51765]|uniref:universal stress protein n=1 Tax=Bradyrhizobium sp. CCBAU 51765 TaxID=1325102 RepID=UPI0018C1355E|nr:universal stress protein [Bradyrhizobium sp. CCBAU 51765]QOZ06691.1 hypothetical protein XH96_03510 [Bradyrhizobium sp. CCBAU 51765]
MARLLAAREVIQMSFRKLLVPLAGVDSDSAAIGAALLLGREFEARIEALYARPARDQDSVGGEIERAGLTRANRVRALFLSGCKSYGIDELGSRAAGKLSASFLELPGIEADLIAEHGRLSDLIVFARPHSTDLPWPNISVQSALRETARPVLLLPSTVAQVGKRSVIAWNGSLEAVRAITFAIPILLRSESTLVVTVGSHDIQPSGENVVEYLKCHGIEAESMTVPLERESESSTLLAVSFAFGADLIVLGAYTRYRTGRPVFGSMTAEMIQQTKTPVFMAH